MSPASAVFATANQAVVTIETPTGLGSGVLVASSGVIVTNLHVVRGDPSATVRLANGDKYDTVEVLDVDARKDLVILKIKGFNLPTVGFADSDTVVVGQQVFAIGSPKGFELSLSDGIVSALRDSGEGYRVIQSTAAVSPGSSGGGLFDATGRLIGITSFKIDGGEALNFAVPANYVRGMLDTSSRTSLKELAARYPKEGAAASTDSAPVSKTPPSLGRGTSAATGW